MKFPDWAEYGLIFYGGPLAIIMTHKNHLKLRRINSMKDYFINEFGLFDIDSESMYRYGKQLVLIYNSHGTSIPKKIARKVYSLYQRGKFNQIRVELAKIYPEIQYMKFKTIYDMFSFIVKNTQHRTIDIDTEKFLPYYRCYNPISIKKLNEACWAARKAVEELNPSLKPPFPIIVAVIIGIVALAFIQDGPKYVREAVAYLEDIGNAAEGNFILWLKSHMILGLQSLFGG